MRNSLLIAGIVLLLVAAAGTGVLTVRTLSATASDSLDSGDLSAFAPPGDGPELPVRGTRQRLSFGSPALLSAGALILAVNAGLILALMAAMLGGRGRAPRQIAPLATGPPAGAAATLASDVTRAAASTAVLERQPTRRARGWLIGGGLVMACLVCGGIALCLAGTRAMTLGGDGLALISTATRTPPSAGAAATDELTQAAIQPPTDTPHPAIPTPTHTLPPAGQGPADDDDNATPGPTEPPPTPQPPTAEAILPSPTPSPPPTGSPPAEHPTERVLVESEHPLQLGVSDSGEVRITLIRRAADEDYTLTIEVTGNIGELEELETPEGAIPGAPLPEAFGPAYRGYATATLAGEGFTITSLNADSRESLEQTRIDWVWSIKPSGDAGTHTLNARIEGVWEPVEPAAVPVERQLWRSRFDVRVTRSLVTIGQLNVISIASSIAGSGLSAPWVFDRARRYIQGRRREDGEEEQPANEATSQG